MTDEGDDGDDPVEQSDPPDPAAGDRAVDSGDGDDATTGAGESVDGERNPQRPADPRESEPDSGAEADESDTATETDESDTAAETNGPDSAAETDDPDSAAETDGPDRSPDSEAPEASAVGGEQPDPDNPGPQSARTAPDAGGETSPPSHSPGVPEDVRTYDRFQKIDGSTYERANDFLRERTYITAREWAIARLCADFRTETGVEMTKIGEHLPELVPFMTDTYSPQAVNQARAAFEEKVRKAGATFLYGAMSDFFTAEELDDVMYEATEVAKFLLEVEGVDLTVEEELAAEDTISDVMREVREHSAALRHDEVACPECGHEIQAEDA